MAEFTAEQLRHQRFIGWGLKSLARETDPVCLSSAELKEVFSSCNIETTPLVQRALEFPETNMLLHPETWGDVTKPEILQDKARGWANALNIILERVSSQGGEI